MHSTVARPLLAETIVQKIIFPLGWCYFLLLFPHWNYQLLYNIFIFAVCSPHVWLHISEAAQSMVRLTTSSCWALGWFHFFLFVWLCPLPLGVNHAVICVRWIGFFSFIYILSLSRRIQTIRRLRGWRLCLKLCRVHAAFLDSASFLKYNPCHFFNTILVSRGFYCPAWWLAGLCLEGARVCSHFSPRRAPALGTVVTAGISEGTHFNVLFNVFASSLLSLLLPNSWKILFIYFISEASSVSCWSNGNFERQKYVSVSALSRGFDLRGRFSLNVKWRLHKLGSFYYNSKLPS